MVAAVYNIHRCVGMDKRLNPRRTAAVIRELGADIVSLHEVDSCRGKECELDQPLFLSESTGFTAIPGPTVFRSDGDYGNVVLTRYPVTDRQALDLSFPGKEPRGALILKLEVEKDRILRVIVTHLGLGIRERHYQVSRLLKYFEEDTNIPLLFMGDINEWYPWSRPLLRLHRLLERSLAPATFPSSMPMLALDRIWIRPPGILTEITIHKSPLSRKASDHLPLKARILLP